MNLGHHVDIVLFEPAFDFNGEIPSNARPMVLCRRDVTRASSDVPRSALWRDECAPLKLLVRLAAAAGANRLRLLMLRPKVAACVLRLVPYIERERPDVIFANLPLMEYSALFAARTLLPPVPPIVPVVHSAFGQSSKESRRRRLLFPRVAHVVAVSRGVAENVYVASGVERERITAIHNPAFSPRIALLCQSHPDHHWFTDSGPPIVLGVGRLVPDKDFLTLLEAFRIVRTQHACRLLISYAPENQKGTGRWLWISWTRIPVEKPSLVSRRLPGSFLRRDRRRQAWRRRCGAWPRRTGRTDLILDRASGSVIKRGRPALP